MSRNDKLTVRQQRFVDEYLIDFNASAAAVRAGFSLKNKDTIARDLLRRKPVADAVAAAKAKLAERTNVTQDNVINELALIAFSNIDNYEIRNGKLRAAEGVAPCVMRAVSSVRIRRTFSKDGEPQEDIEYKLWSKTDAIKMLATHLGMLVERHALDAGPTLLDLLTNDEKNKDGSA